ncbi:MAG: PEP/pyruvate-binding domain-containing protein [Ktedonobacteraceae bacterium]
MNINQDTSIAAIILPLAATSATLELVGGKGASLARMAAAGLPVPPGFHITTGAYRRFVTRNGLQEKILAAVAPARVDQPATLDEAAHLVSDLFAQGVMPDDIAQAISEAYTGMGGGDQAVAVRSSATAEDLPEMSFAGQQETYLNMRGTALVLDAVKRCWASLWTARAIGYRAQHNIAPAEVSLAVVVQELVAADAAGILFTAHPLTGVRDQAMINAAWGLGEAIVGGQVTPDMLVVEKASGKIIEQEIATKQVMTVRTATGTHEEPVPAEKRAAAVLTPAQASELTQMGMHIEQLYGQPMDIEWALQNGLIFVLQARPITALPTPTTTTPARTQTIEWNLPKPGSYMRGSVLELLPNPLSPLFATLGLPAWSRGTAEILSTMGMTGTFTDHILTTINDYGYYNFALSPAQTARLLLTLPRAIVISYPQLMRSARARWQTASSQYTDLVHGWQAQDLATIPAIRLLNAARALTDQAAHYYLSVQAGILPAAYMSELIFTLAYNRFLKWHDAPTALTFMLGYDSAPIQAEKSLYDLAQWARTHAGLSELLLHMSSTDFTHAYQSRQLAGIDEETWSEFRERFAAHLEKFGHTIYDLDFVQAVPADDPASLLETLKFFLSGEAPDPYARQAATAAAREQAVQTALTRLSGLRLSLFRRLLRWAQLFAPLREDALADTGLGWPVLRRMLREIGQRLCAADAIATPDDIFWLKLEEVQAAALALDTKQVPADHHADVAERRALWERERAVTPPVSLPLKGGGRFLGINMSRWLPAKTDQQAGNVIKGIGASPGRVAGPARVITGPGEFQQMKYGDILVAKITTPAWTPLFALASGIVTDVGGPLSHSSIVAREYHIPAVLGTGVATERIHSGQRITVDGNAGTVTLSTLSDD